MISGVERKVHYFVLDLPHSDGCFVKADPAETTEAFLDGHVSAFAFLGGAPPCPASTILAGLASIIFAGAPPLLGPAAGPHWYESWVHRIPG